MSPPFHTLQYRTFCYATEAPGRVLEALRNVVGDVDPRAERASGLHGHPITIYTGEIDDPEAIDAVLRRIHASLGRDLRTQTKRRLDDDNALHLRLDKQAAYLDRLIWARGGDAIAVSAKVEAYPAKRDKALAALETYLGGLAEEE